MDAQKEQQVLEIKAKQKALASAILAEKGQEYLNSVFALTGLVILGQALGQAGYPAQASSIGAFAAESMFIALGVSGDESEELAKDAIALAAATALT